MRGPGPCPGPRISLALNTRRLLGSQLPVVSIPHIPSPQGAVALNRPAPLVPSPAAPAGSASQNPVSAADSDEHLLGQYIPLLYHYNMLQDADRVQAFQAAINTVVQPGMHVLELGGGTGILSSFAARRGAHVTCVERLPALVEASRGFLADNGLDDRVTVVHADAARYVPDSPVDVVVCEMLHVALLREKQAQVIRAFKQNYRSAFDGAWPTFIPEVSILMAQPVHQCFDFAGYHAPVPSFHAPVLEREGTAELAALSAYANIDYAETIPLEFDVAMRMKADVAGQINALRFVTQNVLAVDMQKQQAITWANQCMVLPLATPISIDKDQNMVLRFAYGAGGTVEDLQQTVAAETLA